MVFKSEPSGFADITRPPPKSRKNRRPEMICFPGIAPADLETVELMLCTLLVSQECGSFICGYFRRFCCFLRGGQEALPTPRFPPEQAGLPTGLRPPPTPHQRWFA